MVCIKNITVTRLYGLGALVTVMGEIHFISLRWCWSWGLNLPVQGQWHAGACIIFCSPLSMSITCADLTARGGSLFWHTFTGAMVLLLSCVCDTTCLGSLWAARQLYPHFPAPCFTPMRVRMLPWCTVVVGPSIKPSACWYLSRLCSNAGRKSVCCARDDHSFFFPSLLSSRVQEEVRGGARLVPGRDRGLLHWGEQGHMPRRSGVGECHMPQEGNPEHGLESELSAKHGPFLPENTLLLRPDLWATASCTTLTQLFVCRCTCLSGSVDKNEWIYSGKHPQEMFLLCASPKLHRGISVSNINSLL